MKQVKRPEVKLSGRAMQRLTALDDYQFVRLCYCAILDREPDVFGLETQLAALQAGHSRSLIVESMFSSPELGLRDPDGISVEYRLAFFDGGGFLDPTLRNRINALASRVNADSVRF